MFPSTVRVERILAEMDMVLLPGNLTHVRLRDRLRRLAPSNLRVELIDASPLVSGLPPIWWTPGSADLV